MKSSKTEFEDKTKFPDISPLNLRMLAALRRTFLNLKNENVRSHASIGFYFKIVFRQTVCSRRKSMEVFSIVVLLEISKNFLP